VVNGTATGQFEAGVISQSDARTVMQSAGELLTFSYNYTPEPIITFSEGFANMARDAGVPLSRTSSGQVYVKTNAPIQETIYNQETGFEDGNMSSIGGISLTWLLLIGAGLFLLSK